MRQNVEHIAKSEYKSEVGLWEFQFRLFKLSRDFENGSHKPFSFVIYAGMQIYLNWQVGRTPTSKYL